MIRLGKPISVRALPAHGVEVLASAILDRLLHHAEVTSINGPSYRLKDRMLEQREGGDARQQS
jgi:IstB-like ATP binding protein